MTLFEQVLDLLGLAKCHNDIASPTQNTPICLSKNLVKSPTSFYLDKSTALSALHQYARSIHAAILIQA